MFALILSLDSSMFKGSGDGMLLSAILLSLFETVDGNDDDDESKREDGNDDSGVNPSVFKIRILPSKSVFIIESISTLSPNSSCNNCLTKISVSRISFLSLLYPCISNKISPFASTFDGMFSFIVILLALSTGDILPALDIGSLPGLSMLSLLFLSLSLFSLSLLSLSLLSLLFPSSILSIKSFLGDVKIFESLAPSPISKYSKSSLLLKFDVSLGEFDGELLALTTGDVLKYSGT